ncbi:ATP synthase subunit b precursor [Candidatus Megaera venefica]|uniref:ATP synthase subunit b n=1 Tax=Candidatus Megaera venefica TaxID=2055910 RepID=A0ABU5NCQ5_9RICK|nr:ATP F0F1 synthase subunit B [Candidatus Megaera venefica]MEA0970932.1 ATP synthase subunit b precursor [Candidatus Megaera venefica]
MMHFFDESFVVAVCFVIFIYLAYRPVKKAIIASLDARIEEIKQKLAQAEKLKADAKSLLDKVEKELGDFEVRKKDILESAQNSIERLVETRNKELSLLLARKKDSAIKAIDNEREKASDILRFEFTETVLKLVKTYLTQTKNNDVSDQEIIERFLKK